MNDINDKANIIYMLNFAMIIRISVEALPINNLIKA